MKLPTHVCVLITCEHLGEVKTRHGKRAAEASSRQPVGGAVHGSTTSDQRQAALGNTGVTHTLFYVYIRQYRAETQSAD